MHMRIFFYNLIQEKNILIQEKNIYGLCKVGRKKVQWVLGFRLRPEPDLNFVLKINWVVARQKSQNIFRPGLGII